MACYAKLKEDIKQLEEIFSIDHEVFQINSATVDDLTCTFIPSHDTKIAIHANITVSLVKRITFSVAIQHQMCNNFCINELNIFRILMPHLSGSVKTKILLSKQSSQNYKRM